MFQKGMISIIGMFLLSGFMACWDPIEPCHEVTPPFFIVDGFSISAFLDDGITPVGTSTVASEDFFLQISLDEVTHVAVTNSELSTKSTASFLHYFNFGSVALACTPAPRETKHSLTNIQIFNTEEIEFETLYAAGSDISAFFRVDSEGVASSVPAYTNEERNPYEFQTFDFHFTENLEDLYEGSLSFKLTFSDGHTVTVTSQLVSVI